MQTRLAAPVEYELSLAGCSIALNPWLGKSLALRFTGVITCIHCDRQIKKSFNQGYCYPCFRRLAQCDSCIVNPEKCHYDAGTCREPEWGEAHCMIDHFVYLANTSGLKVGITRGTQIPTRWMDQGATQAQPAFRVSSRFQSGLVELVFKDHISDKTNWRAMLKGNAEPLDLDLLRAELVAACREDIDALIQRFGLDAISVLDGQPVTEIVYPVVEFPAKITSFNLDKEPLAAGTLMGIKGQYLMFDTGVINIRKYGGYHLELSSGEV
jgi:hypothetical protein